MSSKVKYEIQPKNRYPVAVGLPEHLAPYRDVKIYFCIPTRGDDIYWKQVTFLIQQFAIFGNCALFYGINGHICAIEQMLRRLSERTWDYAWFMDADVGPDTMCPLQLVSRKKDIVHAPVWMYDPNQNDIHLNFHPERNGEFLWRHHIPRCGTGLQEIVSGSMASVLFSKKVIDAFVEADEPFTHWTSFLEKDLKGMPADVIFWAKVSKFGFKQYIDWDAKFSVHHRLVELCPESMEYFSYARSVEMQMEMNKQKTETLQHA